MAVMTPFQVSQPKLEFSIRGVSYFIRCLT
jgi:hypothetical protein